MNNTNKRKSLKPIIIASIATIVFAIAAVIILLTCGYDTYLKNTKESVVADVDDISIDEEDSLDGEDASGKEDIHGEAATDDNEGDSDNEIAPDKEVDPSEEAEPDKEANPDKEATPDEDGTTDKDGTPDKDDTPGKDDNPDKDGTPDKDTTPDDGTKPNPGKLPTPGTETGSPLDNHGELSVSGTQLVDKNGDAYQLKGVSTHGLAWFPDYVNYDAFKTLRDEWGSNCIRLAMYTDEYGGYCSGGDKSNLKKLVENGVSYATDLGMYVIIDWHVLNDQDPTKYQSESISFFTEMSELYADYDNVLYEICNEPNSGVEWSTIKTYAEAVIPVIKENNPDAIIIVGTPTWSQDVDIAAKDPITGYSNIMYTLHFYADTHRDSLRQKMNSALKAGLPLFVTEFGICDAAGSGSNNIDEGNKWIDALNSNGISYCVWNLSNKSETCALIASNCNKKYGWTENELSEAGKWYVGILGKNAPLGVTEGGDPDGGDGGNPDGGTPGGFPSGGDTEAVIGTLKVSVENTGGWNDGTKDFYQYTITLSAVDGYVDGWTVTIDFGTPIEVDQSWSGDFNVSGSKVIVNPVEYNKQISSGQSVEVGIIFSASEPVGQPTVIY